jgi:hypothetical protein
MYTTKLLLIALLFANVIQVSGQQKKLEIQLPKPMFVGTPKDFSGVNLDMRNFGKARPAFFLPADCKLISQNAEVISSDLEPVIGEPDQITDGVKTGIDGSYVEFGFGKQYVQIDLGVEYEIFAIVLWHYHMQARVYRDVIVDVSNDRDFIESTTLFNNDNDNSSGNGIGQDYEYVETNEGKLIDAKGTRARYVRLYSNGNTTDDMNHYIEVEVFGR